MKKAFCTIITFDYLPFARTLFQSLKQFDKNIEGYVLIVNEEGNLPNEDFHILHLRDLSENHLVNKISRKYTEDSNALRWSLKSVLMIHLLKTSKHQQVFYVDSDLYFLGDYRFLYEELGGFSFLLSPHWGCIHPIKSELYFLSSMTSGLYNAGFIGATSKGLDTLFWWAEMCLYACEKDKSRGLHDDQTYLNFFPLLNPDSKILLHKGCNVADWNRFEIERCLSPNGELILDGKFPLIFLHFTELGFLVENDPLLLPYLKGYEQALKKNGFEGGLISNAKDFVYRKRLNKLTLFERVIRRIIGKDRFAIYKRWKK